MTEQEYKAARRMIDANYKLTCAWLDENRTNGIPQDIASRMPYASEVNNDLRSAAEVYEFMHDIPDKYTLYIDEAKRIATTWTGDKLGDVTFGREYNDNLGGSRVPISVYAINGNTYYGTYYKSSGDYARVKLSKKQSGSK